MPERAATVPAPSRLPGAAVALALAAMFAFRIGWNVADPDVFHEMALAREALRSGALARADVYAFTPTHPVVVDHEWGAGFVALGAAALGGAGILALRDVLAAAIAALALRAARRAGADGAALALAAPVAILLADHGFSPVRAHLYTFLGVALSLVCLEADRAGGRRWMVVHATAFVAWLNLHGGFPVGLLLLGAYAVEAALARRPFRHVLALAGIEALLTLANPWGAAYPAFVAGALAMPRPRVAEWAPLLAPGVPAGHLLAFALALLLVAYGLWHARPRRADRLVVLALAAAMAVRGHRFLPIFAICWLATAPPLLAATPLAATLRSAAAGAPRALAAAAGAVALAFVVLLASTRPGTLAVPNAPAGPGDGLAYPVGATRFLRESGFRGRLVTTFETGAYVSWKLWPDVLVSLDSRYEVAYPQRTYDEVMAFYDGRSPPGPFLARHAPDAVLVPRARAALRAAIPWPAAYDDGAFAVLVRPGLALAAVPGPVSTEDRFP